MARSGTSNPTSAACTYILGSSDPQQDRLIRQAAIVAASTERLFRHAGIGTGQRVLDLGSGVGDVAMLLAGIVGPSGTVVGIERDSRSCARARARVAENGIENVRFIETDASQFETAEPFDALAGRFILQFLPDPAGTLRSLLKLVCPGGAVVFQEASWKSCPQLLTHLPLWSAARAIAYDTLRRSGANMEAGIAQCRIFQEAGLPAPELRIDVQASADPDILRLMYDLLRTLWPEAERLHISMEALGDFATLWDRLRAESALAGVAGWWWAPVGAWMRNPSS